jgi:YVTN family beta-propeller protein
LTTDISVARSPDEVAVNPTGNTIYVASRDSSIISVINGSTEKIIRTLSIGPDPAHLAFNPISNKLYVSPDNGTVVSINGTSNKIIPNDNVYVGYSICGLAVNPISNKIYICGFASDKISVVDTSKKANNRQMVANLISSIHSKGKFSKSSFSMGIAVNPITNLVYISYTNKTLSVINGTTNKSIKSIEVPGLPGRIAINPLTNMIYVINDASNRVYVINGSTNNIVKTIICQNLPKQISVNPFTNMLYVTSEDSNVVFPVNGSTNLVQTVSKKISSKLYGLAGINVDDSPEDISVNSKTNMIYLTHRYSNKISIIDGYRDRLVNTIAIGPVGHETPDIAVNSVANRIYVTNPNLNMLTIINGVTNKILSNVTIPDKLFHNEMSGHTIAADPRTHNIYLIGSKKFFIIDEYTNKIASTFNTTTPIKSLAVDVNMQYANLLLYNGSVSAVPSSSGIKPEVLYNVFLEYVGQYGVGPEDLAVNPLTNLIYVPDFESGKLFVIDEHAKVISNSTTLGSLPVSVDINPISNVIYVLNEGNSTLSVINGTTNEDIRSINVGDGGVADVTHIAVNPATNMIYVPHTNLDTVSVINGTAGQPVTGISFNTNSSKSGSIYCKVINATSSTNNQDWQKVFNYTRYPITTPLECEARSNTGFAFSSWSGDLLSKSKASFKENFSVLGLISKIYDFLLDHLFGNQASNQNSNPIIDFVVVRQGSLNANFRVPSEVSFSIQTLATIYGLIVSSLVGLFVPSIISWGKGKKQGKRLRHYHDRINSLLHDDTSDQNLVECLNNIWDDMKDAYTKGKINEKHYENLKNEVSIQYEEFFNRKIVFSEDKLDNIKRDIRYVYTKGKMSTLHYQMLNDKISEYYNDTNRFQGSPIK